MINQPLLPAGQPASRPASLFFSLYSALGTNLTLMLLTQWRSLVGVGKPCARRRQEVEGGGSGVEEALRRP